MSKPDHVSDNFAGRSGKALALSISAASPQQRTALAQLSRHHRLKDPIVEQLPPPATGSKVYYESGAIPGFGLCVTAADSRSFVLNYRTKSGRERRITIGKHPSWQVKAAREEAKRLRRLIDGGGDPLADIEADREAPTIADLIARFIEEHLPRLRPGSARMYGFILKNHIAPHFGPHTKVSDIRFSDCDRLHQKITKAGHPYQANRTKNVLTKMFKLAIQWGWRSDNPASAVGANVEAQRKRYLKADELARLTKALPQHPNKKFVNIIRLLLLTGARRGEVRAMRWADIDLENGTWTKLGSTTKQKTDHTVPLSAPARQLLTEIYDAQRGARSDWVFPSTRNDGHIIELKDDWSTLCKAAGISGLRVHDLRHSFASQLASGGASLPLIGALLGHAQPATTARYAHLYQDPQRALVEKVGAIMTGAPAAKTVPLSKRSRRR
jgi:integrase